VNKPAPYWSPLDRPHRGKRPEELTVEERQDVRDWLEEEGRREAQAMSEFRRTVASAREVVASTGRTPDRWKVSDHAQFQRHVIGASRDVEPDPAHEQRLPNKWTAPLDLTWRVGWLEVAAFLVGLTIVLGAIAIVLTIARVAGWWHE